MRHLPLLLLLTACPKNTAPPEVVAEPRPAEPIAEPQEAPSATVPVDGPDLSVHFAFADGQSAVLTQTLIEQTSLPGMMANRVVIESQQHFEVRADGDNFIVAQVPDEVTVEMEGPEELIAPLAQSLQRALQVSPSVIVDVQGDVQDVIVSDEDIAAAHADIAAIAAEADPLVQPAIEQAAGALLDPENLTSASERGIAPWNVGEVILPFNASETIGPKTYTFVGWIPCAEGDTEPDCAALVMQVESDTDAKAEVAEALTTQFADLPDDKRPVVGDVNIDEQYVFVLQPEDGLVRRSAHDKRTTVMLDMAGQPLPYVKNLATAEIWSWE
ncbi:MAG: hypothetical protein KC912_13310 [Proteobacteria bacterium]|nr:hypothetical protein [Pseudomonadota bacterium]